jgi:hypothetical protein
MQNLPSLEKWLNNGISEVSPMLRGDGIEMIFEAVNNGKLPPSVADIGEDYFDDCADGRLFFTPTTSRLGKRYEGLRHEGLSDVSKRESVRISGNYAAIKAFHTYVASEIGCKKAETYNTIKDWGSRDFSFKEIQKALKKDGLNLTLEQMKSIDSNARRRKGIIIEPKESILELPFHLSDDDDRAIFIECPEGLDIGYINGIKFLGPVEKTLMKRFLEGKINYKGFKVEKPAILCQQIIKKKQSFIYDA